MTTTRGDWHRVTKAHPCPVCGKPDWCMVAGPEDLPTAVLCQRVESPKRCGDAGWLHRLRDDPLGPPRRRRLPVVPIRTSLPIDFAERAKAWAGLLHPGALRSLADELGVSALSLRRLGIGWSANHAAWTFPMSDEIGNVVGIRLRLPDGRKLAIKGGKEGIFLPADLPHGARLLVTEGPTDCAALSDLDFSAVGRPSCTGGVKHLVGLVQSCRPAELVIVADADAPGQAGAERLASVLVAYCPSLKLIAPPAPHKDAREWKRQGATAADVTAAIDAAPARRLEIRTRKAGCRVGS